MSTLGQDILGFGETVEKLGTPEEVLNALHEITSKAHEKLRVMGAFIFPFRFGDVDSYVLCKTVFLHKSVRPEWLEEQKQLMAEWPSTPATMARLAIAPFTMSEAMRQFEPVGSDRWPYELALKYGQRDRLYCPIAGRWLFAYWSKAVLHLSQERQALLYLGAMFAVIRLQKLTAANAHRFAKNVSPCFASFPTASVLEKSRNISDSAKSTRRP